MWGRTKESMGQVLESRIHWLGKMESKMGSEERVLQSMIPSRMDRILEGLQ